ncbi:unnamed protein product [Closterium sp. NIES-54]
MPSYTALQYPAGSLATGVTPTAAAFPTAAPPTAASWHKHDNAAPPAADASPFLSPSPPPADPPHPSPPVSLRSWPIPRHPRVSSPSHAAHVYSTTRPLCCCHVASSWAQRRASWAWESQEEKRVKRGGEAEG